MAKSQTTKVDKLIRMLKDNKILALIIVFGIVVIAIGQFADSLNKVSDLFTGSKPKTEIHIAQFTVDESKSVYRAYRFDNQRKIFPSGPLILAGGKIYAFGRQFNSSEEYEACSNQLKRQTNHYFFGWLKKFKLTPSEVPIVIDKRDDIRFSQLANPEEGYPFFLLALQNDGSRQAVIKRVSVEVHEVIPLKGFGESVRLDPLATYVVKISSKEGVFQQDLIPPIKIAGGDAASLGIRVLPEHMDEYSTGKVLIADLTIYWHDGKVTTPRFMLHFED
jgi:hypothetical protein